MYIYIYICILIFIFIYLFMYIYIYICRRGVAPQGPGSLGELLLYHWILCRGGCSGLRQYYVIKQPGDNLDILSLYSEIARFEVGIRIPKRPRTLQRGVQWIGGAVGWGSVI